MVGALIYRPRLLRDHFEKIAVNMIASHILENNGRAGLLLSGGSTPGPIYEMLSTLTLPWQNVDVGLVDERWVDETDKGSNAALIRRTLLQSKAKPAHFIPMKTSDRTSQDGQVSVETNYRTLIGADSLAIIGMGTDGHVCSWFPKSEGLDAAVDPTNKNVVQAITADKSAVTGDYLERMTLTLSALKQCKSVVLLMNGEEKREVLETAMNKPDADLPICHLLTLENLTILHAA